jgi:metal-responsive CopG/Arc/MetJ family transcriptional regulator
MDSYDATVQMIDTSKTQPDRLTAFRLPKDLLETLNDICADLDCNRSQLIRRSLKEYIRFHELDRRKQEG